MTDCTVIIPVVPGHMQLAEAAMGSVVSAIGHDRGPFDDIYVVVGDDAEGLIGRSAARNRMVERYEGWMGVFGEKPDQAAAFAAEWLFFLDADDLMCSPATYGESAFAVMRRYHEDYDCVWGSIHEFQEGQPIMRRAQVDRITTYKAYVKQPAPLTCQMGHFVRRSAFRKVGMFNEELDVCEDVDLYLREWKQLKCIKQEKPLFLNRRGQHSWTQPKKDGHGRKVHTGREWSMRADEMLREARKAL